MMSRFAFAFGLPAALVALACQRPAGRGPAMTPASGTRGPESPARSTARNGINEISSARCDREVRCGSVGADGRYPSRDQCIADLNQSAYDDLDEGACPSGIDQTELSKCLSEVHRERCDAPLDTLERLVACRTAALCAD